MRGTVVKRLFIISALLLVSGLLGTASYAVRELMAALAMFSVGFAALLLTTLICVLVLSTVHGGTNWLRRRAPLWNRAGRDWMAKFSLSLYAISKQAKTVRWSDVWQRLAHRIRKPAVHQPIGIEIDQQS